MCLKIWCDGESEKFCKFFWELNKALVNSDKHLIYRPEQGNGTEAESSVHPAQALFSSPRNSCMCRPCTGTQPPSHSPCRARAPCWRVRHQLLGALHGTSAVTPPTSFLGLERLQGASGVEHGRTPAWPHPGHRKHHACDLTSPARTRSMCAPQCHGLGLALRRRRLLSPCVCECARERG